MQLISSILHVPVRQHIGHAVDFIIRIDVGRNGARRGSSSERRVSYHFNGGGIWEATRLGFHHLSVEVL